MGYATVAEARAEGVPASITDARIQASIDMWSQIIDRVCRQWFESRSLTVYLDGTGSDTLWFPVPIITIDNLWMNGEFDTVVDVDRYNVHNNRTVPDERTNPRITINRSEITDDLYLRTIYGQTPYFTRGARNQKVEGTFGYLEPDDTTPAAIKRAVLRLLVRSLDPMLSPSAPSPSPLVSGPVTEEKTDGHSIKYAVSAKEGVGLLGIFGDSEVDAIVRLYRAPLAMGVPVSFGEGR